MSIIRISFVAFSLFFVLIPDMALGDDPSLTLFDAGGTPYYSPDNSTLFSALPGEYFGLELKDKPFDDFGLYMSLYKTPYPLNLVPPPLLLMPPLFPLENPGQQLDAFGKFNSMYYLPVELGTLGYDLDIFVQGFTWNVNDSFELTNGITMCVTAPRYRAKVCYGWGTALNTMLELGERLDDDVTDNTIPTFGGGLYNGGKFYPSHLLGGGGTFVLKDEVAPAAGLPNPSTSIFLNGAQDLIPGDARFDADFLFYPQEGSSPYIYARDRICRNNENKFLQHIIIPIYDVNHEKTHDLNLYHYKYKTLVFESGQWVERYEYGFVVLDVLTNEFYELTGSRMPGTATESAWKPYVAISPDGHFMSAVLKGQGTPATGDPTKIPDKLYIMRLRQDDTWNNGTHSLYARMNTLPFNDNYSWYLYPESMIFAGAPDPHVLFMTTSHFFAVSGTSEPPNNVPAMIWKIKCDQGQGSWVARQNFDATDAPRTGNDQYVINYFGKPVNRSDRDMTELKWLRSDDNKSICFRAAGRYYNNSVTPIEIGDYAFDVIAFTNITYSADSPADLSFEVKNLTKFSEYPTVREGFYIMPFGQARCGLSKAAISQETLGGIRYLAFCARSYTSAYQPNTKMDNKASDALYLTSLDGSMAGSLVPLTNPNIFSGVFHTDNTRGLGVYDPYFADPDTLLFFCGRHSWVTTSSFSPPMTDLFKYTISQGVYQNLTQSGYDESAAAAVPEPVPTFHYFGTVRPCGIFPSKDGRYIFFFRSFATGYGGQSQRINLVGIDVLDHCTLFDVSGSEFSQGIWPEMNYQLYGGSYYWGVEAFSMIIMPGDYSDKMYFTLEYYVAASPDAYQVFGVNLDLPTGVFPITFFSGTGMVDNIVSDSTGNYVAFSRSNVVNSETGSGTCSGAGSTLSSSGSGSAAGSYTIAFTM
ncbi:MAG: hypothetical protein ABIK28_03675, partial [Planctomycetota bacterium]